MLQVCGGKEPRSWLGLLPRACYIGTYTPYCIHACCVAGLAYVNSG